LLQSDPQGPTTKTQSANEALCVFGRQTRISKAASNFAFSQELDAPHNGLQSTAVAVLAKRWRTGDDNAPGKKAQVKGVLKVDGDNTWPIYIGLDDQVGVVSMIGGTDPGEVYKQCTSSPNSGLLFIV
jgi:hypothetical protein